MKGRRRSTFNGPEFVCLIGEVTDNADAAQVFVANPNKPPEIARILRRNKDRLLVFLKDFHNDKDGRFTPLGGGCSSLTER